MAGCVVNAIGSDGARDYTHSVNLALASDRRMNMIITIWSKSS